MALFRKFFYKKPPDGLLEICERVYVFDYCFTTDVMEEEEYKVYIGGIVGQLYDHFPDASFMVLNMREGENQSMISNILIDYGMTVMDYPRQYEGCPLLTMEMIHHFLRSGENWLQIGKHFILMHCERGGWPVLAFMLASLLIYRKQFTGEQKTLDMIYKQAPRELLQLMSPLNPLPSQLRYLQYISRRNVGSEWPPLDRALTLDCIILRHIPGMDGEGGCRPIFRIYGQDPFMAADRTPKVLFSTPKRSKLVRHYKQADAELVKIDIHCHVQGDVVLECISLDSDLERENMMFRVMFNTAFIRSNILMLNRDEIDVLWNAKDNFPKDFRAEVLFSDMEASSSVMPIDLPHIDEKEGLPIEAFAKVKEMFNHVDWLDSNTEVVNVLQQITVSNILLERLDSGVSVAKTSLLKESLSGRIKFDSKMQNDMKSLTLSSENAPMEKKIELLESKPLPENNTEVLAPMGQGSQPSSSLEPSTNSDSAKKEIESLGSKESLENDTKLLAQGKQSIPSIDPLTDENSMKKKTELLESKEKEIESIDMKTLTEIDMKSSNSAVQGKFSMPSSEPSEDGSMEKKIEPLESKALPENDIKTFAPMGHGKQPISSTGLSTDLNSTKLQTKSLESKASFEKTKFPISVIQGKMDANSMKKKIGMLDSKKKEIESLNSKALLENYRRFKFEAKMLQEIEIKSSTSAVQWKPSMSSFESSEHASMEKKIEPLESKASSENDIKSLTSINQQKQDANSIRNKIEPQELQVAVQLPTQSKIISPRVRQAIRSAPVSYSNSLQGSPVAMSGYHSAPSALGLTTVLQDHAPMDFPQEVKVSLPSTSSPSDSKVPKGSSRVAKSASSPALLPSSTSKSSVDTPSAIERKTSGSITPAPTPPPPGPTSESLQHTVKDSFKGPPPPPSPPPPPPPSPRSSMPPPPPMSGLPSSPLSMNKSAASSDPPPPPPPPHSSSAAAPPPPPASASKSSNDSAVPAPPAPPSANGLSKSNTAAPVPPVPGPPGAPFGAKGRGLTRANPKQSQTRRSNLKPYHWLKLTRAVQGSLWAETQKLDEFSKAPEFDMSELESLFSAAAPNSDKGKSNRRTSQHKADKVQLIELRRAYNCEIMLTKVKIPLPDLMSAVLALDDSVLDVDQVENLIKFCPTKEEMELLKGYNGDKENLGKCEQFFLELMKVPRVENKLRVFCFKMQFCSQVLDLRRDLNIVNSASEEIKNSVKLKRIMQTILSLGNALNQGTARGSAVGFRLDSLLKLTDTRSRNNKMTLMHYLCKVLAEKLPELLDFHKDLENLEAATKIQLKYLAEEMQAISKGLEKVVQELAACENDGPVSENFCQLLKEFNSEAEADVKSLAQLYANVGRNADALALYFGEDPARCPFEQVVSTLLNFVKMFCRAHDENCKQIEYEKKKAEKEAEKLAAKKESQHMAQTTMKSGNIK